MLAGVDVQQHARQRPPRPAPAMGSAAALLVHQLFVEVPQVEIEVLLPI